MGKKQTKGMVLAAIVMLLCAGCKASEIMYESSETITEVSELAALEETEEQELFIYVYVCGEVENPGVYKVLAGARVVDAIEAAGGMTDVASKEYLNLAEMIADGQKIKVPSVEEAEILNLENAQYVKSGLVNLNAATKEELMSLAGIGETKAEDILNYRKEHGGFSQVEELMQIPGIKTGIFQKIKDKITI